MITRPACAGSATARPVSTSGAARCSVFCHANASPKPPSTISPQTSSGLKPARPTASENSTIVSASAASAGTSETNTARVRRAAGDGGVASAAEAGTGMLLIAAASDQPGIVPTTPSTR